jgi:hypothetical protein
MPWPSIWPISLSLLINVPFAMVLVAVQRWRKILERGEDKAEHFLSTTKIIE